VLENGKLLHEHVKQCMDCAKIDI